MSNAPRILVVESPHGERTDFKEAAESIGYTFVGSASDTKEAFDQILNLQPDLVVLRPDIAGDGGASLVTRVKSELPDARVLVVDRCPSPPTEVVKQLFGAGIDGYTAEEDTWGVVAAVAETLADEKPISVMVAERLADIGEDMTAADHTVELTYQEQEVLRLLAAGDSHRGIARMYPGRISPEAKHKLITSIFEKFRHRPPPSRVREPRNPKPPDDEDAIRLSPPNRSSDK